MIEPTNPTPLAGTASSTTVVTTTPGRCPRQAARKAATVFPSGGRWAGLVDFHQEPFRLFFPAAALAGLIGVALWPVMLLGWTENYPGPSHARLMVQGFFGGFILGFMGTAMPRLVEARPFSAREAFSLLALFVGTALHLAGRWWELSPPLELLARLLSYHGFVLLAVLGAGGFLLPRFLGLGVRRKFAESAEATPEWKRAGLFAKSAGALILLTYLLEVTGWNRLAGTARAAVIVAYLAYEMPLERLRWNWRGVQWQLIVGLVCIPLGVFAAGWLSAMRLTLSHLELVGGFALITTGVATRVVFGHSGGRDKLERFHPWLTMATVLMLFGLASRISGDFLPGIQTTHYLYGAVCWMTGLVIWSACVLPRVLRPDTET